MYDLVNTLSISTIILLIIVLALLSTIILLLATRKSHATQACNYEPSAFSKLKTQLQIVAGISLEDSGLGWWGKLPTHELPWETADYWPGSDRNLTKFLKKMRDEKEKFSNIQKLLTHMQVAMLAPYFYDLLEYIQEHYQKLLSRSAKELKKIPNVNYNWPKRNELKKLMYRCDIAMQEMSYYKKILNSLIKHISKPS